MVEKVWFNPDDGWFWCAGHIDDKTAENLIENKGWSVSCSYDVLLADDEGGTENNIKYDMEFLDGEFTHLALVNNPRYERANIVFNSKTEYINKVDNERWITIHPHGEDSDDYRRLKLEDGETPKEAIDRVYKKEDKSDTKDKQLETKDNEAVKRGLDEETVKKQIEKLKKGKEYRINKSARLAFTGDFDNEGMPIFQDDKGNKQGYSLTNLFEEINEEQSKGEKQETPDSPFGEGVEKTHSDRGMYWKTKGTDTYTKGIKSAEVEEFGEGKYTVRFLEGGRRTKSSKTYTTKSGMEKAVKEHLSDEPNKETKALETKTNLEEKENAYKEVLKRYKENDSKRWSRGLSNEEYHKAWEEAEKAKKELTTVRREYAESIMANFETVERNPYEEKQAARRERYEELSEKASRESEQAHQAFRDKMNVIPFGQPILVGHHSEQRDRRYREKAWDTLGKVVKLSDKADYYESKANSVGKAGISADDANAIAKLVQKYKSIVTSAEKRRIIDRVIDIHKNRQMAADTSKQTDYSDLGFEVERNTDINRLQLKFPGKPDEKTRSILKSNGFRWSPREGAWQRQLTGNAEYSLKRISEQLKADNAIYSGIEEIIDTYVPDKKDISLLNKLKGILNSLPPNL